MLKARDRADVLERPRRALPPFQGRDDIALGEHGIDRAILPLNQAKAGCRVEGESGRRRRDRGWRDTPSGSRSCRDRVAQMHGVEQPGRSHAVGSSVGRGSARYRSGSPSGASSRSASARCSRTPWGDSRCGNRGSGIRRMRDLRLVSMRSTSPADEIEPTALDVSFAASAERVRGQSPDEATTCQLGAGERYSAGRRSHYRLLVFSTRLSVIGSRGEMRTITGRAHPSASGGRSACFRRNRLGQVRGPSGRRCAPARTAYRGEKRHDRTAGTQRTVRCRWSVGKIDLVRREIGRTPCRATCGPERSTECEQLDRR